MYGCKQALRLSRFESPYGDIYEKPLSASGSAVFTSPALAEQGVLFRSCMAVALKKFLADTTHGMESGRSQLLAAETPS